MSALEANQEEKVFGPAAYLSISPPLIQPFFSSPLFSAIIPILYSLRYYPDSDSPASCFGFLFTLGVMPSQTISWVWE